MAKKAGKPTLYDRVNLKQVEKLCMMGATDNDLADFYDVTEPTINNWKKAHPEFMETLTRAKEISNQRVVQSLFKRATGYEYTEEAIHPKTGVVTLKKQAPASDTAIIFWLKNRLPQDWRDKQEMDVTSKGEPIRTFNIVPASENK